MYLTLGIGAIIGIVVGGAVLLLVVILVGYIISKYNKLVVARNKVKNSWSQIDVQLKRRFDLIPNLVETVKGYAKHESDIFTQFAEARKMYAAAAKEGSVKGVAQAASKLNKLLTFTAEQYPELKANSNFMNLQTTLTDTEDKIAFNRQFYNDVVLSYNNLREKFPGNIVANMFHFKEAELFEVAEEEKEAPKVKF